MNKNNVHGIAVKKRALAASLKIIIPLYVTYVLFVMSIFLVFMPMLEKNLMDQKKEMLHKLTDSSLSLLSEYNERFAKGELTLEEAQQKAINRIRNLRYGPEGKDYFWILDTSYRVMMHPYVPELEGKDQSGLADSNGKLFFKEMIDTVKQKGSGYVEYLWQWKDEPDKVVPKISFVSGFSPWKWVIGTGSYIDDIRHEIEVITRDFINLFIGILFVVVLMSLYITWQTVKNIEKRELAEKARLFEELRLKKIYELSQMSEKSLTQLTEFALEEAIKLTGSDVGYLAFLNEDETEVTIHNWSKHAMEKYDVADNKMVFKVDKAGLWGEAVRRRKAFIINDYDTYDSPMKKGYPQGHVKIFRHMNIPVFEGEKIVAIAGVGNKPDNYNDSDVRQLELMMDGMWKIIQRKKTETDLRESEERYRMLAENATDNIWILELSDFTFSYCSPSVEQILGFSPEEIVGQKMGANMTADSLKKVRAVISVGQDQNVEDAIDTKRYRILELELIRKDGTKIWAEITACFLRNDNGKPIKILGITRNITDRRDLEQRLRQAQKMEALGTLAGGIAHDFNNILSSVLGFTELVKLEVSGNEETQKNLDQILAAGIRARDLVSHILTFSRKADVQKQLMQMSPLIKECLKFIRASIPPNIKIRHHFDGGDSIVMADPTQIHQIFMNLFTNAAHAMKKEGGVLEVRMKSIAVQAGEILQAKELKPGRYLQLTVADTGCGIPKEIISRIFEPFFTTKGRGEGTGMGLSTVYGIVKDMGGAISVYSEPDMGTTFRIMLPEQQGDPVSEGILPDFSSFEGKGRILLVDDEESILHWTSQVLLKIGYEVVTMTDSRKAFEIFKQNPEAYDLVLTDMAMPRMSGLELSRQMIALRPAVPIILCTGFSEGLTTEMIKGYGISKMIMKPMIASELVRAISNALNQET